MPTPTKSPAARPVVLEIRGCGNITSFKNTKMIARKRLITDPKKQEKMDAYIRAIELGLFCAYQTSATGMATGCSLASWIRSNVPLDDSRHWIPAGSFEFLEVAEGEEGADIIIEKITEGETIIEDL